MPKLTSIPDDSSLAMRRAIMVWASMGVSRIGDEEIDDWCGRHDMIWRNHANRHYVVRIADNFCACHCYHWVEVARRERVDEIAQIIGQEGVHEREVRRQRRFDEVCLAIELDALSAFLREGSYACWREDPAEAVTRRANSLDKRALRNKLDLEFA